MAKAMLLLFAGAAMLCAAVLSARAADTCFHVCLKGKMTDSGIDDQGIRDLMAECHDDCEEEAEGRLKQSGLDEKIAACTPQPVDYADLKKIRSASPSVVGFANAFTWDVTNVLPDRIIRRIEVATQNMALQEVTITASGLVAPGETGTFFMNNVADGYPALRPASRIKAIYACPIN